MQDVAQTIFFYKGKIIARFNGKFPAAGFWTKLNTSSWLHIQFYYLQEKCKTLLK